MPYVITTRKLEQRWSDHGYAVYDLPTRTAVATLKEARETVFNAMREDRRREDAFDISADGGTIGPLPDGTVIEVRPISDLELRRRVGRPSFRGPTREVIAAFNA